MEKEHRFAFWSIIANILLLLLKASAALTSGSLALLSSTFDSLLDVLTYGAGYYSIREAERGPDFDHPFGHRRLEPLASIVLAIFGGILSFEIIKSAVLNLATGDLVSDISVYAIAVLLITVIVKTVMYFFLRRGSSSTKSSALDAMAVDSRNDVFSNSIAVIGVAGAYLGYPGLDEAAAIVIGLYIAHSVYQVARKNYDYIVGARPDDSILASIREKADIPGIKKIGKIRAHYVGDRVHAEINIVLPKEVGGPRSHALAVKVQQSVESLKIVSRAFIHVDYA